MLNRESLEVEKKRLFVEARSGISLPIAGALYWFLLGASGYFLSEYIWSLAAFYTSGLILPLGILLSRPLGANLFLKSPLVGVILPALLPILLSFAVTIPAFYVEPSLVPLSLAVGMSLHWPVLGWLYGQSAFFIHAIVRTLVVIIIWFVMPEARFTLLPLSVGLVYVMTIVWLLGEVQVQRSKLLQTT